MAIEVIHELLLTKVGTNQVSVRIEDYKAWFTIIDNGNPQEAFFVIKKPEWEVMKKFIDSQLTESNILEIIPQENKLEDGKFHNS